MKRIVYNSFLTGICFLVAWFQICPWDQNRYSTYCLAFHGNNLRINPFAHDHVECLKHSEVLQSWTEKGSFPAAVRSGRSESSPDPGRGEWGREESAGSSLGVKRRAWVSGSAVPMLSPWDSLFLLIFRLASSLRDSQRGPVYGSQGSGPGGQEVRVNPKDVGLRAIYKHCLEPKLDICGQHKNTT